MNLETIIYIIFAGIIALLLALFQYFKKGKNRSKLDLFFSFLRFVTLFSVLLLIINPSFEQIELSIEKPSLVIAVDNSSSIKHLKQEDKTLEFVKRLKNNTELQEKFNVNIFTFGNQLREGDSIDFTDKQTNVHDAFKALSQIYKNSNAPTVLLTDGNQTYGSDYQFVTNSYKQSIYPIILGDTISYTDLKIQQLNVNRYAYLKNEFPIETILVYNGSERVASTFVVYQGNQKVYSKPLNFSKQDNSKIIHFTLPANKIGVSAYRAEIKPIENEKNIINNIQNFAVEVINEKTNVAIVSDFPHPDLGALKKSIENNEQRSVSIVGVKEFVSKVNDFQLIILYQPNSKFKPVLENLKTLKKNYFTVVGTKTDLHFINNSNLGYRVDITNQKEDYQGVLNTNYSPFYIDDMGFESFPPLLSNYGGVQISQPIDVVLNKSVQNVTTNDPLLFTFEAEGRRQGVLLGENIWQWRAHSFLENQSFHEFDNFIGKFVQYLASNKKKSRLNIDFQSFYNGNSHVIIKAEVFDKNYVFDTREVLHITVKNKGSKAEKTFPLILKNNHYEVDLSGLEPAEYEFSLSTKNDKITKTGSFQILEYHVEQQFLNANAEKLEQLARNSSGTSYFINNANGIIKELLEDKRYVSVQKSSKNTIPLIDWKYLLGIIALSLSVEWFLRKYNGLI
ncbi:vWA domain-containing protein [Pseudotamlana agarivorans]|uniref:VWA domain-containing protein n=1 Tax=Pseudotamlana agarivorans TaxID=481183 RepID=UPI000835D698|nr:VWA domain-containing protein [Tamlana agarivorans]